MGGPLNLTWALSDLLLLDSSPIDSLVSSYSTADFDFFRIESRFSALATEPYLALDLFKIFFIDFLSCDFCIDFLFLSALFCLLSMTRSSFLPGFFAIS